MARFLAKLPPLESQSDELLHIDLLRFIASYAIVLFHCAQAARGSLLPIVFHFHHFYLVVDLFLVISGFIISFVYDNRLGTGREYATFLWRRVARLVPLHWATLLVFVVLGLLAADGRFHTNHLTDYDWNCLIPNALGLQAFGICKGLSFNYVNWSVSAEMGMYAIAPALLWIGRKGRYWPLLLGVFAILLYSTVIYRVADPWYQWSWDFGVMRALPDFAFGGALFCFRAELARIAWPRLLLLAAMSGFFIGSFLEWRDSTLLALLYLTALAGIACDMRGAPRDRLSALGVYGQLTYSMYMLHPIIMIAFITVIGQRLLHLDGMMMNCWLALTVVMVAPISYLSLVWFETPARRWLTGNARRPTAD